MKYKMIVTDLDDTLLNSKKEVSPIDKEAIMKAQEAGVKFILASGRPTFAMKELAQELKLADYGSYILSFNGSIITDCSTGKNISEESLTKEDIHLMYDFSKKHKTHILTYINDEIVSETDSEYIDVEVNLTKMNHRKVEDFKKAVNRDAVKCMLLEEPSYLKKVEEELKKEYGDKYSIAISKPFFLEVTKLGIDKGTAVKKLADILGIKIEEVIAAGDSFNDLPMLKVAGTSVAVVNAQPEIKETVDFIVSSNDEGGMAELINKFIFTKN
ncbi:MULTISPECIES: Cof-type HAD-IIB family hydrolase [Fusobacterium]|uniref:Cof-type HAD-IIB family hydrolase n=1 Tax=Fusobacterium TaxID=848 RepID=UPI0015A1290D|nr:Cof-type HAD-IIB family hydrolase [Fusobacterium ulcerans]